MDGEGEDVELRTSSEGAAELLDGDGEGVVAVGRDDVADGDPGEVADVLVATAKDLGERHEEARLLHRASVGGEVLHNCADALGDGDPDLLVDLLTLLEVLEQLGHQSRAGEVEEASIGR